MRRFAVHLPGMLPVAAILAVCFVASFRSLAAEKSAAEATEKKPVSYASDILPILQANCQGCHQPAKAGGQLDMTVFKGLLAEGESGMHAVVAGKPDDSAIIEQITPDKGEAAMPKGKPPLTGEETAAAMKELAGMVKESLPAPVPPNPQTNARPITGEDVAQYAAFLK